MFHIINIYLQFTKVLDAHRKTLLQGYLIFLPGE